MYRVSQDMQIALKPPKPWAIAHENGYKTRKRSFLVITLKHVSGHTSHANRPRNPKQWEIAHENDHKTRKRRVFWSYLSNMYRVLRAMQIALEPEKYGQSLMKTTIKRENYG